MFEGLIEDLTRATMADYDRLISRMQLEGDAKRAVAEKSERTAQPRSRHIPWFHGIGRPGAAH